MNRNPSRPRSPDAGIAEQIASPDIVTARVVPDNGKPSRIGNAAGGLIKRCGIVTLLRDPCPQAVF